ncbi:MAG: threonylcarbamoyl-AMP synthase [Chlamydiae bacterium]|nr:threonylcarbamoyl-AMP synthase [Chlamydiota bacterium]
MILSKKEAIDILKTGGIVAVPSETVYGLAASINHPQAVSKIFSMKGRPSKNPLIVHFKSIDQVLEYLDLQNDVAAHLKHFWPGPLTIVAPLKKKLDPSITAGLPTLAARIPSHPVFLELIEAVGPLAAPSANRSGLPSATRAWHIENDYLGNVPIVEGDPPKHGLESTILIQKGPLFEVGRLGALSIEELERYFTISPPTSTHSTPVCPGQMFRHYSPRCVLVDEWSKKIEAVVGFANVKYPSDLPLYVLGPIHDPVAIANNLFETLRLLDQNEVQKAFVDFNFPLHGLYASIRERLLKATQQTTNLKEATHV